MKICRICLTELPLSDFFPANGYKQKVKAECRKCYIQLRQEAHLRNPRARPNDALKRRYKMTLDDYEAMLERQGGRCAICKSTRPGGRGARFCVDHNQKCCRGRKSCGMCVRGLLCAPCNLHIGRFEQMRQEFEQYLARF